MTVDVYVLRDAAGVCLYVGQTTQLRKRLRRHARTQPWWSEVAAVQVEQVARDARLSRTPALIREAQLMAELQPLHSRPTVELARLAVIQA
jgi:predicted GIY-YIG superfamily endonuclease